MKAPLTLEDVKRALGGPVEGMPLTGILTSLPADHPGLPECRGLDEGVLQLLAARTEAILMGAYSDDAVLIWTRGYPVE
jgi:hypothetical protein